MLASQSNIWLLVIVILVCCFNLILMSVLVVLVGAEAGWAAAEGVRPLQLQSE